MGDINISWNKQAFVRILPLKRLLKARNAGELCKQSRQVIHYIPNITSNMCVCVSLENSPHIPVMVKVNMISFQSLFVSFFVLPTPRPTLLISCECVCVWVEERARTKATVSVDFAVSLNSAHSISLFLFAQKSRQQRNRNETVDSPTSSSILI